MRRPHNKHVVELEPWQTDKQPTRQCVSSPLLVGVCLWTWLVWM